MKEERHEEYRRRKGKSSELGLAEEDYPWLRQQWYDEFSDILGGTQDKLLPWREVNHEIHLIDDSKRYHYHLPKVPNSLRECRVVGTTICEPSSPNALPEQEGWMIANSRGRSTTQRKHH
jgi:hypothetical protein